MSLGTLSSDLTWTEYFKNVNWVKLIDGAIQADDIFTDFLPS